MLALIGTSVVTPTAFAAEVQQEGYRTLPLYHHGSADRGTLTRGNVLSFVSYSEFCRR